MTGRRSTYRAPLHRRPALWLGIGVGWFGYAYAVSYLLLDAFVAR